jgi:DNA-binding beta-propeller fold protein YncE
MFNAVSITTHQSKRVLALILATGLLCVPASVFAAKKKDAAPAKPAPVFDYSMIVWPNPPAIARIKFQSQYTGQKWSQVEKEMHTSKAKWMDRLAGTEVESERTKGIRYLLGEPYGLAVDSKGTVYAADQRVGAIFMFNTETGVAELIKNKTHAHFSRIIGLAIDDNDRLFVSDPGLRHVLVFNAAHNVEEVITEGMVDPAMLAIDRQNRLLYLTDIELDQVLVYDADTLKLLRKIGTTGKKHTLTSPGDFAKPTGMAVDADGNLYVCDTLNDRIEVFDADGKFIETYGKNGDGPGYFGRPKGVAIDSDGHIWVADGMQDRIQVFNKQWQLLITLGGHGFLPGQFQALVGITADSQNRIFTSEIYHGRVQQFRYVTDAEFEVEKKRREDQRGSRAAGAAQKKPAEAVQPANTTGKKDDSK